MSKQDEFLNKLLQNGLLDSRKTAVVANAKKMPNGEVGLCLLCVNGNRLCIYDTDFQQNVGKKLYDIELKNISAFKASAFVFNRYIKFAYQDFHYFLADFGDAKNFIATLQDEINK